MTMYAVTNVTTGEIVSIHFDKMSAVDLMFKLEDQLLADKTYKGFINCWNVTPYYPQ